MKRMALPVLAAALVLIPMAAVAGGGGCYTEQPTIGSGTRVGMKGNCFTASALWVEPGQTVSFFNDDAREHQVIGWAFELNADSLLPGSRYDYTFTTAGVYPYACWLHPGMTGVVVVGEPARPAGLTGAEAPGESHGVSERASEPVATRKGDAGTVGSAAAIAGASLGALGFVAGRRRRERP